MVGKMLCCSNYFKVSMFYIILHRWILFYFLFIIFIIILLCYGYVGQKSDYLSSQ